MVKVSFNATLAQKEVKKDAETLLAAAATEEPVSRKMANSEVTSGFSLDLLSRLNCIKTRSAAVRALRLVGFVGGGGGFGDDLLNSFLMFVFVYL